MQTFNIYRFISIANHRHKNVEQDNDAVATSLHQIRRENEVAIKLRKNLEHEMIVLEERKQASLLINTDSLILQDNCDRLTCSLLYTEVIQQFLNIVTLCRRFEIEYAFTYMISA